MSSVSPLPATPTSSRSPRLPRRLDGLAHDVDVAGCLRTCSPAPEASGLLPIQSTVSSPGTRVSVAPVVASLGEPLPPGEVDRDDALRAREPCADHGAETDEPAPEDDARRAGFDLRR